MAQWKNTDNAANSVLWGVVGYNRPPTPAERDLFFQNNTPDAYFDGITVGQYGVSSGETTATSGVAHAGWVVKKEGSGGRAGRVSYETLVAMSSITNDTDGPVIPNYIINITLNPTDESSAAGTPVEFSSAATSTPPGAVLSYQWQVNTGASWADISNGGVYTGALTSTLDISDNTGLDGYRYRVVVSNASAPSVTSTEATLTVT